MTVMVGDIASVIRNDDGLYNDDLVEYFRVLFFKAQNVHNPYHNLRHMLHVTWLCHEALRFMCGTGRPLTRRSARNLLIAAMFHDFNHSGQLGDDDLNIQRAIRSVHRNILPIDVDHRSAICLLIRATEFPHRGFSSHDPVQELCVNILRDADLSQALSVAWIQQVVIGLASEWSKPPIEVLRAQKGFHEGLLFRTEWARAYFPANLVKRKIEEAGELLQLLEPARMS